jgi:membrane associated rhomboid family serine protease
LSVDHVLRTTTSPTQAGDWDLVLESAGIGHRVDERDGQFALLVDAADAGAAAQALAGFDEEGAPEQQPAAPDLGWSPLGLMCAAAFVAMALVTGPRAAGSAWFAVGSASADAVWRGAWWRAVTALTLHSDLLHVAGNALASLVFISACGRWLGTGLAAVLILAAGTLGNLLTMAVKQTNYDLVGSSTATFAALGMIAGLQVARRLKLKTRPGYWWVPIGAGLAMFAMTGVGENASYHAHLFGLGFGVAIGVGWAIRQLRRGQRGPGRLAQALLAAGALGAVAGCWLLAFRYGT